MERGRSVRMRCGGRLRDAAFNVDERDKSGRISGTCSVSFVRANSVGRRKVSYKGAVVELPIQVRRGSRAWRDA